MTRHRLWLTTGILATVALALAAGQESGRVVTQSDAMQKRVNRGFPAQQLEVIMAEPQPGARGRYRTLLRVIEAPQDRATYGDFCDYGYWPGTSYLGHTDLTPGYWVYLAPNWYIYKDADGGTALPPLGPRRWGPEQATGAPDTWPKSGDIETAWASKTPDGQREWLELTYDVPLRTFAVMIYETYNPGAVDRITGYDAEGKEIELWKGEDPTPAGSEKGISVIPLHSQFDVTRIRIYLDSPKVPGWNEIDAVGAIDATGHTHWAVSATASSTYADVISQPVDVLPKLELREK